MTVTYTALQKKGGYRKSPVGQDALIVAFSYKDNKAYFGKQKITILKDEKAIRQE